MPEHGVSLTPRRLPQWTSRKRRRDERGAVASPAGHILGGAKVGLRRVSSVPWLSIAAMAPASAASPGRTLTQEWPARACRRAGPDRELRMWTLLSSRCPLPTAATPLSDRDRPLSRELHAARWSICSRATCGSRLLLLRSLGLRWVGVLGLALAAGLVGLQVAAGDDRAGGRPLVGAATCTLTE